MTLQEKRELARSDALSLDDAVVLSIEEDTNILRLLAKNSRTPVYILIQLAQHNDWRVRCRVARNPDTPIYLLNRLAKDESRDVRYMAAKSTLRKKVGNIELNSTLKLSS